MGFSVMNFEAVTPSGLARHIWRALHPEESSKLLSKEQIDFIVGFLSETGEREETELLKKSISAVRESILQDRFAGASVTELLHQASTAFQKAYVRVFEAYERYLKDQDRLDSCGRHDGGPRRSRRPLLLNGMSVHSSLLEILIYLTLMLN